MFVPTAILTEDFCGVEPITHPPILRETRPPPIVDPYKVEKAYHRFDSILWGSKYIYRGAGLPMRHSAASIATMTTTNAPAIVLSQPF